jgi:ATP-binding cassette subfamily B protein
LAKRIQIQQRDITDCGAACLCSVAGYYRKRLPVSLIRQYAGTDRQGTTVLGLVEAADRIGLQAKAVRSTAGHLHNIPLPAIAHTVQKNGLHHFVVIYRISAGHITIMDPLDGKLHRKPLAGFTDEWRGILVLCSPGEDFTAIRQASSHAIRLWQLAKPHRYALTKALAAVVIYTLLGFTTSIYLQKIVDFVLVNNNMELLHSMSIIMVLLLGLQLFIGAFKAMLGMRTAMQIDTRLILGYYRHLLQLPQRFFDTMRTGEMISRVNDAVKIRVFINEVSLDMFVNILVICFTLGIMFLYYWKLALAVLVVIPVFCLLYFAGSFINKKWRRILMENSAEFETQMVESLTTISTIKYFGLENLTCMRFEKKFMTLLNNLYRSGISSLRLDIAAEITTRLLIIAVLWAGSYFVICDELSIGELLSFYALSGFIASPIASVLSASRNIQDALVASDRLFEIIDLDTEASPESVIELTPGTMGNIRFHSVSFSHDRRKTLFEDLTITIPRGKITAIVGENGSGKSTLFSLIQGLYLPNKGSIHIGDTDIRHISRESLRRMAGIVPQRIDLFAGTIAENISLDDPDPDMPRIVSLSVRTGIHDFIDALPAGYHTMLNEQGINLSGGQKQRIAIVRALYRNPEVLLLDEATSLLDVAGEQKVLEALRWYCGQGKTCIIIVHKLNITRDCDNIIVLKEGKVVEQGSDKPVHLRL